jgi:hypothetical protein
MAHFAQMVAVYQAESSALSFGLYGSKMLEVSPAWGRYGPRVDSERSLPCGEG